MAMLFTDWGSGDDMNGGGGGSAAGTKVSIGRSSMWIKVCSEYVMSSKASSAVEASRGLVGKRVAKRG